MSNTDNRDRTINRLREQLGEQNFVFSERKEHAFFWDENHPDPSVYPTGRYRFSFDVVNEEEQEAFEATRAEIPDVEIHGKIPEFQDPGTVFPERETPEGNDLTHMEKRLQALAGTPDHFSSDVMERMDAYIRAMEDEEQLKEDNDDDHS